MTKPRGQGETGLTPVATRSAGDARGKVAVTV